MPSIQMPQNCAMDVYFAHHLANVAKLRGHGQWYARSKVAENTVQYDITCKLLGQAFFAQLASWDLAKLLALELNAQPGSECEDIHSIVGEMDTFFTPVFAIHRHIGSRGKGHIYHLYAQGINNWSEQIPQSWYANTETWGRTPILFENRSKPITFAAWNHFSKEDRSSTDDAYADWLETGAKPVQQTKTNMIVMPYPLRGEYLGYAQTATEFAQVMASNIVRYMPGEIRREKFIQELFTLKVPVRTIDWLATNSFDDVLLTK